MASCMLCTSYCIFVECACVQEMNYQVRTNSHAVKASARGAQPTPRLGGIRHVPRPLLHFKVWWSEASICSQAAFLCTLATLLGAFSHRAQCYWNTYFILAHLFRPGRSDAFGLASLTPLYKIDQPDHSVAGWSSLLAHGACSSFGYASVDRQTLLYML